MIPSLAVYGFGYQLDRIRYPWREALASASELVGESGAVYFCACDDETAEEANKLSDAVPGLFILRHTWLPFHHTVQAKIANYILNEIGTKFDYALKMDMDEVLCDWTFRDFEHDLELMANNNVVLAKPNYRHFCPDDRTIFPFIYPDKAVISRTKDKLRFGTNIKDDACALGGAPEYSTHLLLHHYGKMSMGREREALYKERSFTEGYEELGFPDPKVKSQWDQGYIDYMKVFDVSASKGEFRPYDGPQPVFVQKWLKDMRLRHEQFVTELTYAYNNDGA